MSDTPETGAAMLLEREGITHPELHETYMAWTDYWALGQHARSLERRLRQCDTERAKWKEWNEESQTELEAVGAERDAALRDAERYRWLREQQWDTADIFVIAGSKARIHLGTHCPSGDLLDAAVDAALAEKGKP